MSEDRPRKHAASALKQAERAARKGDLALAERWSKVAAQTTAAAERLAALPPEPDSCEDDEALRAEIRERLRRIVEVDYEMRAWDYERQIYDEYVERAAREGLPPAPPLRPCPYDGFQLEIYARKLFNDGSGADMSAVDEYYNRFKGQAALAAEAKAKAEAEKA